MNSFVINDDAVKVEKDRLDHLCTGTLSEQVCGNATQCPDFRFSLRSLRGLCVSAVNSILTKTHRRDAEDTEEAQRITIRPTEWPSPNGSGNNPSLLSALA